MVGVRFKDGVKVDTADSQILEIRKFLLNPEEIPPEIVPVQIPLFLFGRPKIGLTGFIFSVDTVDEGHFLVWDALIKSIRENLIHRSIFDPGGGGKIRFINRQLPAVLQCPGQKALGPCAAADFAEIGVEVKIVKIQPRGGGGNLHLEMVGPLALAGKLHPVMYRGFPVLCQNQVRVYITKVFRYIQMPGNLRIGRDSAKWRFILQQTAVKKGVRHSIVPSGLNKIGFGTNRIAKNTAASTAGIAALVCGGSTLS